MYTLCPNSIDVLLFFLVFSALPQFCTLCQARHLLPTATIGPRAPPEDVPVTVAPQTAVETGAHKTMWVSYGDLTTFDGTPTVVPLWHCGPVETAAACKGCPAETPPDAPACEPGFNGIVLYPIGVAVVIGGIVPPPEGLPTLTIGDDGGPATLTDAPEQLTTETAPATTTMSAEWSVAAACPMPSLRAADYASAPLPDIPTPAPRPPPGPVWDAPTAPGLPVLGLPVGDPKNPDWGRECGASSVWYDPYAPIRVMYDYPTSFSYVDGYNAIEQFCYENIGRRRVIGHDGAHPENEQFKDLSAVSFVQKSFDTPSSGKLQIHVQFDKEGKNREGKECPNDRVWVFTEPDAYSKCRQILGQLIETCDEDPKGDHHDVNWKHGGTLYTSCTYWSIVKTPPGEEGNEAPPCSPPDRIMRIC